MELSANDLALFTADAYSKFITHYPQHAFTQAAAFLEGNLTRLVQNITTHPHVLSTSDQAIFATLNYREYDNAHICSPYAMYFLYPQTMLKSLDNALLRTVATFALQSMGALFRLLKFNHVVQIHNTFGTSLLYSDFFHQQLSHIQSTFIRAYPQHALILPKINQVMYPELFDALKARGFLLIPVKPVHLFIKDDEYFKKRDLKRDIALLKKSQYDLLSHQQFSQDDLVRVHALYQMLFREKFSKSSPDFTPEFFAKAHANHWYTFEGLRSPEGRLDAFVMYEKNDKHMITGPLGYEFSVDQSVGLYRMIAALPLMRAYESGLLLDYGMGNEHYKMNRGSQRVTAYDAVYVGHLPWYRQLPWKVIHKASQFTYPKFFENRYL